MELDDRPGGRWLVETVTAVFVIDLGARTIRRSTQAGRRSGSYVAVEMRGDGAELPLIALIRCRIGESMVALVEVLTGTVTIRLSTPVRRLEAIPGGAHRNGFFGTWDLTS